MSKTKTFERGHFWSNFVQTFFIWCQITKILRKIFFLLTGQISGVFGEFVCGNSWRAGRRSLKFIPRMLHVMPFIVNFTFEIYIFFFIFWIRKNIWIRFLRAMFNWSPQFYTHLFRSLFELLLILWQFLLLKQLVPNYRLKVKLQLRTHPKI